MKLLKKAILEDLITKRNIQVLQQNHSYFLTKSVIIIVNLILKAVVF
ncbi:hypothetical protein JCM19274_2532 [Algibacter lectus]|uniref:Uncharacterized protein n=1 Tax=Algibacter lectus TaxID=221126 RepID=A0A090WRW6_9FLAO|nr:hypothetical protein JCM19274_2532 [Algibacter lectus]